MKNLLIDSIFNLVLTLRTCIRLKAQDKARLKARRVLCPLASLALLIRWL